MAGFTRFSPIALLKNMFGYGPGRPPRVRGQDLAPMTPGDLAYLSGEQSLAWAYYQEEMRLESERTNIYRECDLMDDDDVMSAALDLYAEDASVMDLITGKSIWVKSKNPAVLECAESLLERIDVEDLIFPILRELAKYGDSFSGILQELRDDGLAGGIFDLLPVKPVHIHRHEDEFRRLKGFSIGPQPDETKCSQPWDYLHWRLTGKHRGSKYGWSMIADARRAFRRMRMSEDALLIYRLRRAPDRFVFYYKGLEHLPPEERFRLIDAYRTNLRKKMLVDPSTGTIRQQVDPLAIDDDIHADQSLMDVQRLTGSAQFAHVLDVDFFRKRLYGCLKIPGDYLGFADAKSTLGRSSLADQDIRYARTIKRLQRAGIEGFVRLIMVDLNWRGINSQEPDNEFSVHMMPVSYLDELQRAELTKVRAETIRLLQGIGESLEIDKPAWISYVLKMSGFPEEVVLGVGEDAAEIGIQGSVDLTESQKAVFGHLLKAPSFRRLVSDAIYNSSVSSKQVRPHGRLPGKGEEGRRDPKDFQVCEDKDGSVQQSDGKPDR